MLPSDIQAFVARHFPAAEQAEVITLLADARQADGAPIDARLLRCALWTSGKTLLGLSFELDWLRTDSRDVIQGPGPRPVAAVCGECMNIAQPCEPD